MTWKKAGLLLVVLVLSIVFRLPVQAQEQRFSQTASATVTLHLTGTDQLPEANRDFRLIPMDSDIILEQSAEAAAAQARQLDAAWFENQDGNWKSGPRKQHRKLWFSREWSRESIWYLKDSPVITDPMSRS